VYKQQARNYARITTKLWADPDWRALTVDEQWCYMALLTQPKLTLAGSIDMKQRAWQSWASDAHDILGSLAGLEIARFIKVDMITDEVAIRTFVTHDDVLKNRNLGRGMWSAWEAIESGPLKVFLVDNFPNEAWEPRFEPPFPSRKNHGLQVVDNSQEPWFSGLRNHGSNHGSNLLNLQPRPTTATCNLQPSAVSADFHSEEELF